MRHLNPLSSAAFVLVAGLALAAQGDGPYHVLKTERVGGEGSFDYVYADSANRKLYVPRLGQNGRVTVFDLDTLAPAGEIPNTSGHGVAVDTKFEHAFVSSNPVAMWDAKTLKPIKTIQVQGHPDGILGDPYLHRVYILSHEAPNITVIDAKDGSVVGTIDVGGEPEQSQLDGKGHMYVDLENKGQVAVVDTAAMKMTGQYDLAGKGAGCAGLALDARNHVLFVACREPARLVILDSTNGKYLTELPIGAGCDGATFNPKSHEAFTSQRDGTLTITKEDGHGGFSVEQTVTTMPGAKTITLDEKTGNAYLIAAQTQPAEGGGRPRPIPGSFSVIVVGKG